MRHEAGRCADRQKQNRQAVESLDILLPIEASCKCLKVELALLTKETTTASRWIERESEAVDFGVSSFLSARKRSPLLSSVAAAVLSNLKLAREASRKVQSGGFEDGERSYRGERTHSPGMPARYPWQHKTETPQVDNRPLLSRKPYRWPGLMLFSPLAPRCRMSRPSRGRLGGGGQRREGREVLLTMEDVSSKRATLPGNPPLGRLTTERQVRLSRNRGTVLRTGRGPKERLKGRETKGRKRASVGGWGRGEGGWERPWRWKR